VTAEIDSISKADVWTVSYMVV